VSSRLPAPTPTDGERRLVAVRARRRQPDGGRDGRVLRVTVRRRRRRGEPLLAAALRRYVEAAAPRETPVGAGVAISV
jgi:hypothetical protein